MNIEQAYKRLDNLSKDSVIQNYISQANARYILYNTSEDPSNFPKYTINDSDLNLLAFYYLEIGCTIAESGDIGRAAQAIEQGGSILEYVHGSESATTTLKEYYSLIAALAYYVSFHYSKSFILINKCASDTIIAKIISCFLRRDITEFRTIIDTLLVNADYSDEAIYEDQDIETSTSKIYALTIAKAINALIHYLQSGDNDPLLWAKEQLLALMNISELNEEPAIWWIVRLLLLICNGIADASLWKSLGKHFDLDSLLIDKYIRALIYSSPRGIYELFITQRNCLPTVLNATGNGSIVTIPTSSGKTRIAEIAILKAHSKELNSKILYIAPFRSLSFEVEGTLSKTLGSAGINVSQLYGGGISTKLDSLIIGDSDVVIVTPEKAKAILRADNELAKSFHLIILDEGHLLGFEERLIKNEIFYEELRYFMKYSGGKFLVLSAVLPNPEDLANWLTGSEENIFNSNWRPSDERLGILEWDGRQVNINWISKDRTTPSFNNRFVSKVKLPRVKYQKKDRFFPDDKNEAVAAATYKLRGFGVALIFVGLKASVFTMAKAYLKSMGAKPIEHRWNNLNSWKSFELACIEIYGINNPWLSFAKYGILCHNADLHGDVRLPLERLMRSDKPLVIIATSTLGQGVNLGVSTVVFSTIYQAKSLITTRDFWNIAGRAGRAFVDNEAKVLVALDKSSNTSREDKWRIAQTEKQILGYFDKDKINLAQSGILCLIDLIIKIAASCNINYELLFELLSENTFDIFGENEREVNDLLDYLDDGLLALLNLNSNDASDIDYNWIDEFFKESLTYIQSRKYDAISPEQVLSFFRSRVKGIVKKVGLDRVKWKSIIQSGIPLNSNLFLENILDNIITLLKAYANPEDTIHPKIALTFQVIRLIRDIPILTDNRKVLNAPELEELITQWMTGEVVSCSNTEINTVELEVDLFTFKLPWLFNAVARKIRLLQMSSEAELMEDISLLLEVGLPDINSIIVYQAGIRSRKYCREISNIINDLVKDRRISSYSKFIIVNCTHLKKRVSATCAEWIDILVTNNKVNISININMVPDFTWENMHKKTKVLIPRLINSMPFLISPELKVFEKADDTVINFSSVSNIEGVYFQYYDKEKAWKLQIDNPFVIVK